MRPLWTSRAFEALAELTGSLPSPLDERFARVRQRLGGSNGADSLEGALGLARGDAGPRALRRLSPRSRPRRRGYARCQARGGMIFLYLHVRIQATSSTSPRFDRSFLYLAEVFSAASARAFAEALCGSAGFFAFRERVLARFAADCRVGD